MLLFASPTTRLPTRRTSSTIIRQPRTPRRPPTRITPYAADKPGRSAWPVSRFFQTALFYSPLGNLMRGAKPDLAATVRAAKASAANPRILVTGATGGTGRRVVRSLLDASRRVRALTRSRQRLVDELAAVGVDAEREVKKGTLDIFVSDLYNLPMEIFDDVAAVVSCTGVKVGQDSDPDRSRYFRGSEFDPKEPPKIMEDTPEHVEYVGIRNLVNMASGRLATAGIEQVPVLTFKNRDQVESLWGELDDVVMGGVSKSGIRLDKGCLVFSGFVSTDNSGGFASIRTVDFDSPVDLGDYEGLILRVKGDGKSYKMIIRCDQKWDGIAHCYTFPTISGEVSELRIPFSDFNTVFRAKTLKDGKRLDASKISALQVMLSKFEYDGDLNPNFSAGPFELRMLSVAAYKNAKGAVTPKFVHVGSAGSTRVLRPAEFPDKEAQPPAVQMNEMLGRIMEWKLAGEDVIRTAGIPYCIVRPCALTIDEAVGVDALNLDQGDSMTGKMSRNDLASLILKALGEPTLTNVTVEVCQQADGTEGGRSIDEQIKGLKEDSEEERTFAAYPYVPEGAKV